MRLTRANLQDSEAALDEVVELMQPLADAWSSIRPQATKPATGA
jgi:flagellin-specific chaperone FliS